MEIRRIADDEGREWVAVVEPAHVAHLKEGAVLGFRPADEPEAEPIPTAVSFNSMAAAEFAVRNMGEKELKRRLDWARVEAGLV